MTVHFTVPHTCLPCERSLGLGMTHLCGSPSSPSLLTFICPQPNRFAETITRPKEGHRGHPVWQKPEMAEMQAGAGCVPFPRCRSGPA